MPSHPLALAVLADTFAVCRLDAAAPVPSWASTGNFFSVTRTADELSVVCRQEAVPDDIRCEGGWRCFRVVGTIPFAAVGILASLTGSLAAAGIGLFAISTFDTDYLLVKKEYLVPALDTLRRQGHVIQED